MYYLLQVTVSWEQDGSVFLTKYSNYPHDDSYVIKSYSSIKNGYYACIITYKKYRIRSSTAHIQAAGMFAFHLHCYKSFLAYFGTISTADQDLNFPMSSKWKLAEHNLKSSFLIMISSFIFVVTIYNKNILITSVKNTLITSVKNIKTHEWNLKKTKNKRLFTEYQKFIINLLSEFQTVLAVIRRDSQVHF